MIKTTTSGFDQHPASGANPLIIDVSLAILITRHKHTHTHTHTHTHSSDSSLIGICRAHNQLIHTDSHTLIYTHTYTHSFSSLPPPPFLSSSISPPPPLQRSPFLLFHLFFSLPNPPCLNHLSSFLLPLLFYPSFPILCPLLSFHLLCSPQFLFFFPPLSIL